MNETNICSLELRAAPVLCLSCSNLCYVPLSSKESAVAVLSLIAYVLIPTRSLLSTNMQSKKPHITCCVSNGVCYPGCGFVANRVAGNAAKVFGSQSPHMIFSARNGLKYHSENVGLPAAGSWILPFESSMGTEAD
jgi:hypothetical protein